MVAPISMVSRPKSSSIRSIMGDGIQVVDAAVAAVGPYRFILGLLGQKIAVFVVEGARAADHTAAVAAVGCGSLTAAGIFQFGLGLTADLGGAFETALG
jgi:hypothetical protein